MTAGRELLAVAGTHGKTTTSAMLAVALKSLGPLEPRALVGADVPQFSERLGALVGAPASPHFVLEADEYDGAFLQVNKTCGTHQFPPTHSVVASPGLEYHDATRLCDVWDCDERPFTWKGSIQ